MLGFRKDMQARSRSRFSCCKALLLTSVICVTLALLLTPTIILYGIVKQVLSHRAFYHYAPVDEGAQVVLPLIGDDQSFDVAVTVWLRSDDEPMSERKDGKDGRPWSWKHMQPPVKPLFSDIVFRGLYLKDKNIFSTVNFTVPTAYFKRPSLTNYDLRGSIVLIPTSPSPLEHIVDYSSWIPDKDVDVLPVRSWPFPLGSTYKGEKTLGDNATDSFGVTFPLIQFHAIDSQCGNLKQAEDAINDDEEVVEVHEDDREPLLVKTDGKSVWTHHPYIVTRTHIRVAEVTNPFKAEVYENMHYYLKRSSCKQREVFTPTVFMCDRSYSQVGHLETQMDLFIPNESTGESDWVQMYSPYISVLKATVGPKDLVAVPVNRERCLTAENTPMPTDADDRETVDVSWKLSFSGQSLTRFIFTNLLDETQSYWPIDTTASDHHQSLLQDNVELTVGVWGHRQYEHSHPRRRFVLWFLAGSLSCAILFLDAVYWFTRKSTVSISFFGTLLFAAALAVEAVVADIAVGLHENSTIVDWLWVALSTVLQLVLPLLIIKALFRIGIGQMQGSSWAPVLFRRPPTHGERTSERLDSQMISFKIAISASIIAFYCIFTPYDYVVIQPVLPAPLVDDYLRNWLIDFSPYICFPLGVAGPVLQIILNWQSRTFAGSFRLSKFLSLAVCVIQFMDYMPMVVGYYDARPRLVAHELVNFIVVMVAACQALLFPPIDQDKDMLHDE